jgi:hypothetical protein
MITDDKGHELLFVMHARAPHRASRKTVFAHYYTSLPRNNLIMTFSVLRKARLQVIEWISCCAPQPRI